MTLKTYRDSAEVRVRCDLKKFYSLTFFNTVSLICILQIPLRDAISIYEQKMLESLNLLKLILKAALCEKTRC